MLFFLTTYPKKIYYMRKFWLKLFFKSFEHIVNYLQTQFIRNFRNSRNSRNSAISDLIYFFS